MLDILFLSIFRIVSGEALADLSAIFRIKPSQTTTSAMPVKMSFPSMLPMKFSLDCLIS